MRLEMQPVILAGGEGSKMYPLTEEQAKCLLPIGNIPMICYVVSYLEKHGFEDFIIIVRKKFLNEIQQSLNNHALKSSKFEFVEIPEDDESEDIGTAEALALVDDKAKTDLLVVSSDMITNAPLHRLIDIHRTYNSSLTAMFANHIEVIPETDSSSKNKRKEPSYRDITAVDSSENRLLYFTNEADLEQDSITISKSLLKRYPKMNLQTNKVDCHLFVMKRWLLKYLCSNVDQFESFKSDFVPHIIHKQFSKVKKKQNIELSYLNNDEGNQSIPDKSDIHSFIEEDEIMKYMNEWSGYQGNCLNDSIKCHAHHTDSFCLRINTLPAYTFINRQMEKLQKEIVTPSLKHAPIHKTVSLNSNVQVGKDCMIGESSKFSLPLLPDTETSVSTNEGDRKSKKSQYTKSIIIKRSIIGNHCSIGANVRITNCIIMNNVTVEDGCIIQGSIICNDVTIQASSALNNCQVSSGQTVPENSKLENESVVREEMEFEDDDDMSD